MYIMYSGDRICKSELIYKSSPTLFSVERSSLLQQARVTCSHHAHYIPVSAYLFHCCGLFLLAWAPGGFECGCRYIYITLNSGQATGNNSDLSLESFLCPESAAGISVAGA